MSEYVAAEYEGTRPAPGGPGNADDASARDKAVQPAQAGKQAAGDVARTADTAGQAKSAAQDGRQLLQQSPACERKR
jgi:hypothetical protein